MSRRERVKKAMDFEEPDRVPIYNPMSWTINFAGNNMNCLGQKEKDINSNQWLNNVDVHVDSLIKSFDHLDYDIIMPYLGEDVLFEAMGCTVTIPDWDAPVISKTPIDNIKDWENLNFPAMDHEKMLKQYDAIRMVEKELNTKRDEDIFISGTIGASPFTFAGVVLGMDKFMYSLITNPDEAKELIEFCTDVTTEYAKAQIDAGADQIWAADPTASGSLISPEMFREFALPYAKKQSKEIQKYKDKYAYHYHICGETQDRLEDLIAVESSMISLDNRVSFKEVKEKAGDKLCMVGNINPVDIVCFGTPEAVEQAGKQCISDAASGGGFIYWAGCDFAYDCPLENIEKFYEVPQSYGNYPISNTE
ncbi:uroporphyrinogen decarboxylase family protein [Methanolobus sp. ZRKC2]|uniref:uroporphyrinogen decarboxylase family protein n=1 Tax=Methanolobus sp. ZRKC2 TaxID=3125783 RepID=UPI003246C1D3